jgi:type II secretory pathway component PulF
MARIGTKQLAQLCRRVGTALHAGLDVRSAWNRETQRGPLAGREHLAEIGRRLNQGDSLADAVKDSGGYFPPLAAEMITVGESTGRLEAVLLQLADHYDYLLNLRRNFLAGITWPAIQLAATIVIIGLVIWIMGIIGEMSGGETVDILGLGLTGNMGLLVYVLLVASIAGAITALVIGISRGWLWTGPLMQFVLKIPLLGRCLQDMAISRMAWSLAMAIDAGMSARPAVRLAMRSTQNAYYTSHVEQVDQTLESRGEIHDALRRTNVFPDEFLDALETGEQTGLITESMLRESTNYRDRAQATMGVLSVVAGFACWGLVAVVIIFFIFRLAMFYIGTINSLVDGF